MNQPSRKWALPALRWAVGLVVLLESCRFVLSHGPIDGGLPGWIRPVIGGSEVLAAILFLLPFARVAGAYLLVIIFAVAALIHVLHGQYDVGALVVYAMAVLATMDARREGLPGAGN